MIKAAETGDTEKIRSIFEKGSDYKMEDLVKYRSSKPVVMARPRERASEGVRKGILNFRGRAEVEQRQRQRQREKEGV